MLTDTGQAPRLRRRRSVWLPVLVGLAAFALRFAGGAVQVRRGDFLQFDGHDYNDLAVNLAAGRGYLVERVRWFECPREVPAPDFSRPPLAPMVVAAFYAFLPDSLYVAAAAQAAVGTAFCFLVAALARSLWGARAGLLVLVLAGGWPVFIYHAGHFSTEALASLLVAALALSMVLLARDCRSPAKRAAIRAAVAGAVLGLSALCRPNMLVGFALVPLWAFFFLDCARARRAALAGVILAAAVLTVGPWTARNAVAAGDLIPVTNFGGYTFWYGNNEHNFRAYSSLRWREFDEHQLRFLREETPRLVSEMHRSGHTSPKQQERFWLREGLRFVKQSPGKFLFLVAAKTLHFFRPWVSPSVYGVTAMIVSLLLWGPLYAIALLGLVRLWRNERAAAAAVLAVVISGALAHVLTFLSVRHRVPFVDTAAVCLAAPVLLDWGRAWTARARAAWTARRAAGGA